MTGHSLPEHPHGACSAEELFRAWAPNVARILARLGVPRADLDDAVQEVFLTAHRRGGYVEGAAKPQTWLYEIALRTASNARRRTRRRPTQQSEAALDLAPATARDPHESAELRQQLDRVAEAIERIPGEAKLTFVLAEIDGASAEEVARIQGIALGTVYSRLHNARKTFRAAYAELAQEPDPGLIARIRSRLEALRSPLAATPTGRATR
jgi:RNA polymerase sigma-70 factor, ECF subfamily